MASFRAIMIPSQEVDKEKDRQAARQGRFLFEIHNDKKAELSERGL